MVISKFRRAGIIKQIQKIKKVEAFSHIPEFVINPQ